MLPRSTDWLSEAVLARAARPSLEHTTAQIVAGYTKDPKLQALLKKRVEMSRQGSIDWGFGELLALGSVLAYLGLKGAGMMGWVPKPIASQLSPLFTFFGVAFPTLGANLSGIRYFGDFERFAAISRVAAEKLRAIETRTRLLLSGDPLALTYAAAADLIHALDEAVVEEIASWQAVFGAKHLALPA
jgi:hypothetical protein